jgi:eukaryotic-like serine/threonine-protein kinase
MPRRAVHYLELAGDHAAAAFANEEALALYRWALDLIDADAEPLAAEPAAGLWLKLESILERLGRFAEASAAAREALTIVSDVAPVLAARCHFSLARLDVGLHRVEEAFASFDTAEFLLRDGSSWDDDDWAVWFDVKRERAQLHYWRNEPHLGIAVLKRAAPFVEERGTSRQKAEFHSAMANQRFRKARYLIDNSIVDEYRTSWAAAVNGSLQDVLYGVQFSLGLALLCHGDLAGARAEIEGALRRAKRVGDRVTELRCLTYLAKTHLRQHDVRTVSEIAPQANELASSLGFPEYVGMARAMMAWVAWREVKAGEVEELSRQALEN